MDPDPDTTDSPFSPSLDELRTAMGASDRVSTDHALQQLAADGRVAEAARGRARRHWLRQQAGEGSSVIGLLLDLAESGTEISVDTTDGQRFTGRADAVGVDYVLLTTERTAVAVALSALVAVRSRVPMTGDRSKAGSQTLSDLLGELSRERDLVTCRTLVGPEIGELDNVGADVISLRGSAGMIVSIPIGAIVSVSFAAP